MELNEANGTVQRESFLGTPVVIYTPREGKSFFHSDLVAFLKKFQTQSALEEIGKISGRISFERKTEIELQGVPIAEFHLAYLAALLIEVSDDYAELKMTENDIVLAVEMFYGLPNPQSGGEIGVEGLLRLDSAQFVYQYPFRYLIARTILLFDQLWTKNDFARTVDLNEALHEISSTATVQDIVCIGWVLGHKSNEGYLIGPAMDWNNSTLTGTSISFSTMIDFTKWMRTEYQAFRDNLSSRNPSLVEDDLLPFRFNPLQITPLVRPVRNPAPGQVYYAVPLPRLLVDRATRGLYHYFREYYKSKGDESFLKAFGTVLEDYIILLLQNHQGSKGHVYSEFVYGDNRKNPDAAVILDDNAVFIQVKQSGLYLEAKSFGDNKLTAQNLSQTLAEAVRQQYQFELDIASGRFNELKPLRSIKKIERLIVTHDSLSFSNSVIKNLIKQGLEILYKKRPQQERVPDSFEYHVITLDEFETLAATNESIFHILESKKLSPPDLEMDFRQYFNKAFGNDMNNSFLDKEGERLMTIWIESITADSD